MAEKFLTFEQKINLNSTVIRDGYYCIYKYFTKERPRTLSKNSRWFLSKMCKTSSFQSANFTKAVKYCFS